VPDQTRIERFAAPNLSHIDSSVIACAIEHRARAILSDDISVRRVAEREGLSVIGTVGILTHARLIGWLDSLKPPLDPLIREGFYLDASGHIYQDALRRAGER
jgi:predicted nucleic acid-binding protein